MKNQRFMSSFVIVIVLSVLFSQLGILQAQAGVLNDSRGIVIASLGPERDIPLGIVIQPDGKIVVSGFTRNRFVGNIDDIAVVRYNPNGSLDSTFDLDGMVITNILYGDQAHSVAMQADGKILVTGHSVSGSRESKDFTTVRYNTDGSLDTTFDGDGIVRTKFGSDFDEAYDLVVQDDGKIVVAGYCRCGGRNIFALARYNPDGSLDTNFDHDGRVTSDISSGWDKGAAAIALQDDGKIIAAGFALVSSEDFALVRYNSDGSLDTSFGNNGVVITLMSSYNERVNSIVIQPDGKILVTGTIVYGGGNVAYGLARYLPDGNLDTSFSGDGKVIGPDWIWGSEIVLQSDGKIVITGGNRNSSPTSVSVVRFNPDGELDTSFGVGGMVTTWIGDEDAYGTSIAYQEDGKIFVAGASHNDSDIDFALLRYNSDGSLDEIFGYFLPIADPNGPYLVALGSAVAFDGTGSYNPGVDPLNYDWDFGDESNGIGASPSHTYLEVGIYDVCLTVDDGDNTDTSCTIAVVYDPDGGFVTGGGWIYSHPGAYAPEPSLEGKASFGFVSKYKKGVTVPTGNTEFQFQVAALNFHSISYDWLVVTGNSSAKFKGIGTINGEGEYKFQIWAGDDDPDTFRIKIWEEDDQGEETVVYDNGFVGSGFENGQPIGGGSIVVHTKK
jgi:uncharacterized delta-60 repeat protein